MGNAWTKKMKKKLMVICHLSSFPLFTSTEIRKYSIDFIDYCLYFLPLSSTFSISRYYDAFPYFSLITEWSLWMIQLFFKNLHNKNVSCIIKTLKINYEDEVTHWEVHLKNFKNSNLTKWWNYKKLIFKKYSKLKVH